MIKDKAVPEAAMPAALGVRSALSSLPASPAHHALAFRLLRENVYVCETNKWLTAALQSSCNVQVLGDSNQVRGCVEYVVDYCTKESTNPTVSAGLLNRSIEHTTKYPSGAEDTGTDQRRAQHLITNYMNRLGVLKELPVTLAAHLLFGRNVLTFHSRFWALFSNDSINFVLRLLRASGCDVDEVSAEEPTDTTESDNSETESDSDGDVCISSDSDDSIENVNSTPRVDVAARVECLESHLNSSRAGGAMSFRVNDKRMFFSQSELYSNRCEDLNWVDLASFVAYSEVVPKKSVRNGVDEAGADHNTSDHESDSGDDEPADSESTDSSFHTVTGSHPPQRRRCNATYEFKLGFPLCETHHIRVRSKFSVLLLGSTPVWPGPRPALDSPEYPAWRILAIPFSRFVLVLFKPWYISGPFAGTPGPLTVDNCFSYLSHLRANPTIVNKHRLMRIHNIMHSNTKDSESKKLLREYRAKNSDAFNSDTGRFVLPGALQRREIHKANSSDSKGLVKPACEGSETEADAQEKEEDECWKAANRVSVLTPAESNEKVATMLQLLDKGDKKSSTEYLNLAALLTDPKDMISPEIPPCQQPLLVTLLPPTPPCRKLWMSPPVQKSPMSPPYVNNLLKPLPVGLYVHGLASVRARTVLRRREPTPYQPLKHMYPPLYSWTTACMTPQ
jgi:hypothetical protein